MSEQEFVTSNFSSLKKGEVLQREQRDLKTGRNMSITARLFLFLIVPTAVGSFGLLVSYLNNKFGMDEPGSIDIDRDFVIPFLVAMVMIIVVNIQTLNFSSYEAKPLISWPKVIKKKKIIKKTVLIDDDGNVIDDQKTAEILKKLPKKEKSM